MLILTRVCAPSVVQKFVLCWIRPRNIWNWFETLIFRTDKNNCWEGHPICARCLWLWVINRRKTLWQTGDRYDRKNIWKSLQHIYYICITYVLHMYYICITYVLHMYWSWSCFCLHLHRIVKNKARHKTKQGLNLDLLDLTASSSYTWRSARVRQMIGKKVAAFASFDMLRRVSVPGYKKMYFFPSHGKFWEFWVLRMEQARFVDWTCWQLFAIMQDDVCNHKR